MGKLGFATLSAILKHDLYPADQIVCTSSSKRGEEKLEAAQQRGVQVRRAGWDDSVQHWCTTLQGCTKLFLISSSRIAKDFGDPYPSQGRETDHFKVLEAALQVGIEQVYYSSLAFANPSQSRVMEAHARTEAWLQRHTLRFTLIREGLYNESWPLYFGHYSIRDDERQQVVISGDSQISWTSIADLGLAGASILTGPSEEWAGKTVYLAQTQTHSLTDVASMVSKGKGRRVKVNLTSRDEYERHYIEDHGMDRGLIRWWSRTYDALVEQECEIRDTTLEKLLERHGVTPKPMEETVAEMLASEDEDQ